MDTKQRILDTASRLFYQQGFASTGINQVIAEADVAKGSLYNHFESKSALGQAYVKQVSTDWFNRLEAELELHHKTEEKLLAVFSFLEKNVVENRFNGCRLINILTEVAAHDEEIRMLVVDHKQKFRKLLHQLAQRIEPDLEKAQILSDSIYLLYEGATVESKIYLSMWPVELAKSNAQRIINSQSKTKQPCK